MTVNNIDSILWTERYRPTCLDELIVPKRVKEMLNKGVIQSMLLYGTAGTGKTSAARAITRQFKHNTLYLNMSETYFNMITLSRWSLWMRWTV